MYNTTIHSTDYFETYSLLPLPLPYTLVVNWLQFVSFGIPGFSQFSVHRDVPASIKVWWGPIREVYGRVVRVEGVHPCDGQGCLPE